MLKNDKMITSVRERIIIVVFTGLNLRTSEEDVKVIWSMIYTRAYIKLERSGARGKDGWAT